jgi:dienelactone hydrolase
MRNAMMAIAAVTIVQSTVFAQPPVRAASLPGEYRLDLNVSYPSDGMPGAKLDVFARRSPTPSPVVIWWHGSNLDKEYIRWLIPPLLEMGFSVVIPQAPDSPTTSPDESAQQYTARVLAGRCALRWTFSHASDYQFDINRVIVAGTSLGGYSALMSGLTRSSDGFDRVCPGPSEPQVAAILDFYGPIRLRDGIAGDNPSIRALTYVRKAQPPVFVVHGDADPNVPYSQSVELDRSLTRAGAAHEFLTVPGGGHGLITWDPDQLRTVWTRIGAFLDKYSLSPDRIVH